jgi:hypothetical protein
MRKESEIRKAIGLLAFAMLGLPVESPQFEALKESLMLLEWVLGQEATPFGNLINGIEELRSKVIAGN